MYVGGSLIWIEGTENRTDTMVFDPGYEKGQLHIYQKVESIDADAARQEIEEELGREPPREDLSRMLLKSRMDNREPSKKYGVKTSAGGMNDRYR